jgi:hypothetical protein
MLTSIIVFCYVSAHRSNTIQQLMTHIFLSPRFLVVNTTLVNNASILGHLLSLEGMSSDSWSLSTRPSSLKETSAKPDLSSICSNDVDVFICFREEVPCSAYSAWSPVTGGHPNCAGQSWTVYWKIKDMRLLGLQNALAGFINSQSLGNSWCHATWEADPNRLIDPRINLLD